MLFSIDIDELILLDKGFSPIRLHRDNEWLYRITPKAVTQKHKGGTMHRYSKFLIFGLAIAVIANMTYPLMGNASAAGFNSSSNRFQLQANEHVGLVIAYTAGQSITIMDRDGNQFTFELAPSLKIVPPQRTNLLAPGAFVTIIAPNNVPGGKQIAQVIVIHPGVPGGFPVPSQTITPFPTQTSITTGTGTVTATATCVNETAIPTETPGTPIGTPSSTETSTSTATAPCVTEPATPTETPIGTPLSTETATPAGTITLTETPTATPTAIGALTETMTPTATPSGASTQVQITTILDALRSLLRQLLSL